MNNLPVIRYPATSIPIPQNNGNSEKVWHVQRSGSICSTNTSISEESIIITRNFIEIHQENSMPLIQFSTSDELPSTLIPSPPPPSGSIDLHYAAAGSGFYEEMTRPPSSATLTDFNIGNLSSLTLSLSNSAISNAASQQVDIRSPIVV